MADGADNMLDGDRTEVDGVAVLQVLIFLSDGRPNPDSMPPPESDARPTPAEIVAFHAAADQSYGIAIGPNLQGEPLSEPDLALMNQIADPSGAPSGDDFVGGNYRHVVDAASLPNLFADIQEELLCGDLHVDKKVNGQQTIPPVLPGTAVTYTYDVTNSGETPMFNIVVTDDVCAPAPHGTAPDVTGPVKTGGSGRAA